MNYIGIFKTSFLYFPIIALFITIPYILHQYHKYGSISKFRTVIIYSFILYLLTIYFLVILPLPTFEEVLNLTTERMRLIPFGFVMDFINETSLVISDPSTYLKALIEPCVYVVVFNIFMTMPFGMYLRYYFKLDFKKTVFCTFLLSLFFELTQLSGLYFIYPRGYRLFDVDDLMLNTLGGLLGYFLVGIFMKFLPSREKIDEKSIQEGLQVSGLRRITMFFLDLFLYFIILGFLNIFFSFSFLNYIVLFFYYVVIPYCWNGQTLGGKFLHIRLEFHQNIFRLIGRTVFYYCYYLGWVILMFSLFHNLESYVAISLSFFLLLFLFFFYLIHFILILKNRTIYYDNFIKVSLKSTIVNKTGDNSNEK